MKLLPDSNLFPSGREHYKDWAGLNAAAWLPYWPNWPAAKTTWS